MPSSELQTQRHLHDLYSNHHGWLYRWLHRRLGNAADSADLAHDAFLRLLSRSSPLALGSLGEARAYLRTTAQNLCINLWRRQEIERAWLETLAAVPEAAYPSAERQAIIMEALAEISNLLDALPPKTAQAFLMAVVGQMTDAEVGAHLGISDRMVRKHVVKAMFGCLQLHVGRTLRALQEDGTY